MTYFPTSIKNFNKAQYYSNTDKQFDTPPAYPYNKINIYFTNRRKYHA